MAHRVVTVIATYELIDGLQRAASRRSDQGGGGWKSGAHEAWKPPALSRRDFSLFSNR